MSENGKDVVVKMKVRRVMSPEECKERERRLMEEPEYHLLVLHRSGRVVYSENFLEVAEFGKGFPEETGFLGKLHERIIEEVDKFEDGRKPKKDRKPVPPFPDLL